MFVQFIVLCLALAWGTPAMQPGGSRPGPDFAADSLPNLEVTTIDGESVRLRELLGPGVTVVNLWATWCLPCRDEIPDLNELFEQRSADVWIVGIAVESGGTERVRRWLEPYDVRYPIAVGVTGQQMIDEFRAPGLPFTLLVGPEGAVHRAMYGQQTRERLERALEAIQEDRR